MSSFSQVTVTYNCTGAPEYFTVPPCVTSIDIVAVGGAGGGATGGGGASVSATIPVTPGDILQIVAGCEGGCPVAGYPSAGAGSAGSGGSWSSCGGGGMSYVSFPPYTLGDAFIVAGGGGGMGGGTTDADGGDGGCPSGLAGEASFGGGGGGGTAASGGGGGAPWGAGTAGSAGGFGTGGAGAPDPCYSVGPGGGGGSGWYGGGGGGGDCFPSGALGGGGGGGGSSLVPGGGACAVGVGTGDGYVTITYVPLLPPVGGTATVSPDPICEGDNVILSLAGWTGTSIQWESAPSAAGPWTPIPGATSIPYVATGITANTCFRALVVGDCLPNAYSTIDCVTVDPLPTVANAGPDQAICGTTTTLAGNAPTSGTGVWTIGAGGSTVTTPTNPTSGVTGLTAGVNTYTWTITSGVCPPSSDVVSITAAFPVNAGLDGSTTICNTASSFVNLNTLLSGADPGGVWAETSASGSFDPVTGILNTDGLTAGTYNFTYTATADFPCPPDVADFTVVVQDEVSAGLDNTASICNSGGSTIDLNTLLSGADPGGTWAETSASGAFNPATGVLNADGLAAGTYNFTYTVAAIAPCVPDV
ncbi:MAG: hypothetical protein MI810_01795, partial [Flavobacteriales bacterium]|nr:hypothetical protein [Flavobacteriales bacterium]